MLSFLRRKSSKSSTPRNTKGGGLLGRGVQGAATGSTFAGLYGLGSLLGGSDGDQAGMGGPRGGFGTSRGIGASGSGSSNYTPSASATSVLSDADSSDPVVRQLQDIEKVLVSIKGDTSILAAGTGGMGVGQGKNNPALQGMYGQPQRSGSDLKSFLPLLLASMFGFFNQEKGNGGDDFVDNNYDGVNDIDQDPIQAATEGVADPKVLRQATNLPKAAVAGAQITTEVARGAVTAGKGVVNATGTVMDVVRGAGTTAEAGQVAGDVVRASNVVDFATGKPIELPPELGPAANEGINPDAKKPPPVPDVDPNSIKAKVGRGIGKFIGKTLPGAGDLIALGMMGHKLGEGDFEGAFYEGASIASTAVGTAAAAVATTTGVGALGAPALVGAGIAGSTYFDYKSITRDLYKEIFGHFPKDDPDYTPEREQEVLDAVVEYIKNLPADMMGPSEPELQVEARPEVTARSGHAKRNQEKTQATWDKKYGEMYNPDGMMKPELVPAAKAEAESQGAGFPGRIKNRADILIEDARELGGEIKEGAERLAPGLKITSDSVEVTTESAARVDQEKQASMMGATIGESVATNQKVQGTGVLANQPSVNVSVAGTKTSFPTDNAALASIMRNGSYAV